MKILTERQIKEMLFEERMKQDSERLLKDQIFELQREVRTLSDRLDKLECIEPKQHLADCTWG